MFIPFRLNPFYAPEGDVGGNVSTEEVADLSTDEGASTDPFDSLSFSHNDEKVDDEPEVETTETEEVVEEAEEEVKLDPVEEKRTSKQTPEVDALYARTRKAEENAARLEREINEHKEWQRKQFGHDDLTKYRQETEKQTQEQFQSKINEQWKSHLDMAQQMRDAGYDERVVTQYLDAQKTALTTQEENRNLQQQFNQFKADQEKSQRENVRLQQENSANEGKKILLDEHKALKGKYGDLVPKAKDFDELVQNLGPEIVGLIANNGLNMEQAFKLVNSEKIAQHESSLVEKRTTANIVDRSKKTVETNKTEKKPEDTLTEGQKRFAKEFGVDPKEVAKRSNPQLLNKKKGVS